MARTYSTRDGDVVDRIAYAHYGEQSPAILRAVFDANPGLAARGPVERERLAAAALRLWIASPPAQPHHTESRWKVLTRSIYRGKMQVSARHLPGALPPCPVPDCMPSKVSS